MANSFSEHWLGRPADPANVTTKQGAYGPKDSRTGTAVPIEDELPYIQAAAAGLVQTGVAIVASDADTPANPSYNVTVTSLVPLPAPVSQVPDVQAIVDTINKSVPRNGEAHRVTSTAGPPQDVTWTQT